MQLGRKAVSEGSIGSRAENGVGLFRGCTRGKGCAETLSGDQAVDAGEASQQWHRTAVSKQVGAVLHTAK